MRSPHSNRTGPHVLPEAGQGCVAPPFDIGSGSLPWPSPYPSGRGWAPARAHANTTVSVWCTLHGGSDPPVEGSRHTPISVAAPSARFRESAIRDRQMDMLSPLNTLRMWLGFCFKAARLSTNRMESGDIQRGQGGHFSLGGTGSRVLRVWNFASNLLSSAVGGRGVWSGILSFPWGIGRGNGLGIEVAVPWAQSDQTCSCPYLEYWQSWSGVGPSRECNRISIGGRLPDWLVTNFSGLKTCGAVGSIGPGIWDCTPRGGPTRVDYASSSLHRCPSSSNQVQRVHWSAADTPQVQAGVPTSKVAGTLRWAGSKWDQWLSCSLPLSARGSAWNQPPTQRASPSSPDRHRPEISQRWTGAPLKKSRRSQDDYVSKPLTVFSYRLALSCQKTRVPPLGWPAPSQSLVCTGCLVSWLLARVGVRAGGAAMVALCADGRCCGGSFGKW